MVVLNAIRCNPWLRQYYERLRAAGKPGKVAVTAAMRKLLTAVWSVATHRKPFVPHLALPAQLGAVTNTPVELQVSKEADATAEGSAKPRCRGQSRG